MAAPGGQLRLQRLAVVDHMVRASLAHPLPGRRPGSRADHRPPVSLRANWIRIETDAAARAYHQQALSTGHPFGGIRSRSNSSSQAVMLVSGNAAASAGASEVGR